MVRVGITRPKRRMSRGEMIRRLDEAQTAAESLTNGPLAPEEQHAIAETLTRLLPLVADSLQDQIDAETAARLEEAAMQPRLRG
jgi:hypothetical protein